MGVNEEGHIKFEDIFNKQRKFNVKNMDYLHKDIFIAPNHVGYVRKVIREGILP